MLGILNDKHMTEMRVTDSTIKKYVLKNGYRKTSYLSSLLISVNALWSP